MARVKVTLYTLPGSHPGQTAMLMLKYKGIPFKRRDLVAVLSKTILRVLGYPRNTVPAMNVDGVKTQGSRQIARELERLRPEPPLFPADAEKRAAVEEAERWGDEEFQHPVRQVVLRSIVKQKGAIRSYLEGAKLGIPIPLAAPTAPMIVAMSARLNGASEENVRADLESLGGLLQHVDDLIAAGTINGPELNAADFQIAPTIRLAMTLQDLRPLIEGRPAEEFAKRVQPEIAGDCPPALPAEWLEPLRGAAPASA
jgi:glutathione S-transferase